MVEEPIKTPNTTLTDQTIRKIKISQHFFNPLSLLFYDAFLFNFISPYLWGCSKNKLISRYKHYCGKRHLEVGVGTGYLIDRSNPSIDYLGLMDLSQACLNKTKNRLKRYSPAVWQRNILAPINDVPEKFDTLSINYVMHCVPGAFAEKGIAFKHLKPLLFDEGVLFGISVIQTPQTGILARVFLGLLNKLGVFNNSLDKGIELEQELARHFKYVNVEYRSTSVLFYATDSESRRHHNSTEK